MSTILQDIIETILRLSRGARRSICLTNKTHIVLQCIYVANKTTITKTGNILNIFLKWPRAISGHRSYVSNLQLSIQIYVELCYSIELTTPYPLHRKPQSNPRRTNIFSTVSILYYVMSLVENKGLAPTRREPDLRGVSSTDLWNDMIAVQVHLNNTSKFR